MARRFPPDSDRGLEAAIAQFLANLGPIKTALGLPANWEANLATRKTNFTTTLNSLQLAEAAYRQAKQSKDTARMAAESEFRNLIRQLRSNPNFTDAMAASLGLPVRDREPTPVAPPSTAPLGEVDTSQRLTHRLYFWHMDSQGARRGKPAGAVACEVWRKVGGSAPLDLSECEFVGAPSRSPYRIVYSGEVAGQTVHYLLRWRTARGEVGPLSETLSATVTG